MCFIYWFWYLFDVDILDCFGCFIVIVFILEDILYDVFMVRVCDVVYVVVCEGSYVYVFIVDVGVVVVVVWIIFLWVICVLCVLLLVEFVVFVEVCELFGVFFGECIFVVGFDFCIVCKIEILKGMG